MPKKFSRQNQTVICRCCGKRTHQIMRDQEIEMCGTCIDSAENENSHNDGNHDLGFGCPPLCPVSRGVTCLCELKKP